MFSLGVARIYRKMLNGESKRTYKPCRMGKGTLPNFIIIGAPRCGTTSLYAYLRQHPDVYMSPVKEPNFFLFGQEEPDLGGPDGKNINRDSVYRLEDYKKLFAAVTSETAVGEASPRYLDSAGTAARIHQMLPDAKLIVILRNPVQRALSHFSMRKRDGWEPCDTFEQAMADEPRRLRENWAGGIYLQRGFYSRHLRAYLENFPQDQIRAYLYEDLQERPHELLADLFSYIGVDPGFRPDISRTFNASGVIKNPALRWIWTRTHRTQRVVRPLLPKSFRKSVSNIFTGLAKAPVEFPPDLLRELAELFRSDIIQLQQLIKRDLSAWLQGPVATKA